MLLACPKVICVFMTILTGIIQILFLKMCEKIKKSIVAEPTDLLNHGCSDLSLKDVPKSVPAWHGDRGRASPAFLT